MAFWYTYKQPTQDGADWKSSLLGILPGAGDAKVGLAHQVFAMVYGTPRGTAPPSIWGSVYYNFGWPGLILTPILLAICYQVITSAHCITSR